MILVSAGYVVHVYITGGCLHVYLEHGVYRFRILRVVPLVNTARVYPDVRKAVRFRFSASSRDLLHSFFGYIAAM